MIRGALAALALAGLPLACTESKPLALDAPTVDVDAGPPPGAKVIALNTIAPRTSNSGGSTNATWAAYRRDDGLWAKLTPTGLGTYSFWVLGGTWAVAVACANESSSLVAVHEDVTSVTAYELTLEEWCGTPGDVFTLTGNLSNVPPTTRWLDFGYGLEARGVALPVNGTTATYEEVNVAAGTWDLLFGLRDSSFSALTKVAVVRGHVFRADSALNVDFGAALTPGSSKLVLHGIDDMAERTSAEIHYTTNGGVSGLDMNTSTMEAAPDVAVTYGTIPVASQAEGDRYLGEIDVRAGEDDEVARGAKLSFHTAADFELALLAPLAVPNVSVAATTPYLRMAATTPARPAASRYELEVLAKNSNRSQRRWRVSRSASVVESGPDVVVTMPDLNGAEGFSAEWALAADVRRDSTLTVREAKVPFGDGTVEAFVAHTVITRP